MQLGLPFAGVADAEIPRTAVEPIAPIYFVRHRRARRYLLRVEHDGRVRVTIPRGGSRREADAFARRHLDWVLRQRAALSHDRYSVEDRRRERSSRFVCRSLPISTACA